MASRPTALVNLGAVALMTAADMPQAPKAAAFFRPALVRLLKKKPARWGAISGEYVVFKKVLA
jgi:hypothetical protein